MKRILTLAITASMLAACSDNANDVIELAKNETSPVKALEIVRKAKADYLDECRSLRCNFPLELARAEYEYFEKAARAGDASVLRELFSNPTVSAAKISTLGQELKGSVLKQAETSGDADLLVAAASISGDEQLGIINTEQEINFRKRAWLAGDARSAGQLAHIHVRMKRFHDAYFWSLRCIDDCRRRDGVRYGEHPEQTALLNLAQHLDAEQISKLQTEAGDRALDPPNAITRADNAPPEAK